MEKKAIIFDLDGTLINTLDSLYTSVNMTLNKLCLPPISMEQCRSFIGNGVRTLVKKSMQVNVEVVDKDNLDQAMEIFNDIFNVYCGYNVCPYDGIRELLHSLKESGYILAILTNKPHFQAVELVNKVFGKDLFALVQGQVDELPKKPDPKSLWNVINSLSLLHDECIYIGDSTVDIDTGNLARVDTIAVSWGFNNIEDLKACKVNVIVDYPGDIIKNLSVF